MQIVYLYICEFSFFCKCKQNFSLFIYVSKSSAKELIHVFPFKWGNSVHDSKFSAESFDWLFLCRLLEA